MRGAFTFLCLLVASLSWDGIPKADTVGTRHFDFPSNRMTGYGAVPQMCPKLRFPTDSWGPQVQAFAQSAVPLNPRGLTTCWRGVGVGQFARSAPV